MNEYEIKYEKIDAENLSKCSSFLLLEDFDRFNYSVLCEGSKIVINILNQRRGRWLCDKMDICVSNKSFIFVP